MPPLVIRRVQFYFILLVRRSPFPSASCDLRYPLKDLAPFNPCRCPIQDFESTLSAILVVRRHARWRMLCDVRSMCWTFMWYKELTRRVQWLAFLTWVRSSSLDETFALSWDPCEIAREGKRESRCCERHTRGRSTVLAGQAFRFFSHLLSRFNINIHIERIFSHFPLRWSLFCRLLDDYVIVQTNKKRPSILTEITILWQIRQFFFFAC